MKETNGWAIAFQIITLALLVWFLVSWWDVATNNSNPENAKELATHSWNLFVRYFG